MLDGELNPAFDTNLLSRIEDAGLNASAPPQQRWLDGWLVRFSPGKAKRARCVSAVAVGRLPVDERLAACAQVFEAAKLPLIVRLTPFTSPPELDSLLEAQGLARFDDTRVMALADVRCADRVRPLNPSLRPRSLRRARRRLPRFAARATPGPRRAPAEFSGAVLRVRVACRWCAGRLRSVRARRRSGRPLRCVHGRVGARAGPRATLCKHLLSQAHSRGARHAYLQVESDNHAARSVYRRLGFTDAYAYHYRTRDPSAA